jgi:hypothetical protein
MPSLKLLHFFLCISPKQHNLADIMVYKTTKEITQHKPNLTLTHDAEPRTLTYLPGAPKPNLEKHAKTEF